MNKFMKVINHGANPIDLSHIGSTSKEVRPVELHYNTNGSLNGTPTIAIVMEFEYGLKVYGQMSLDTLDDCMNQLGYEIKE